MYNKLENRANMFKPMFNIDMQELSNATEKIGPKSL